MDYVMISETKLDDSFTSMQFHNIKSHSLPFELDCSTYELGTLVFVCGDIPCKDIVMKNNSIEGFQGTEFENKKLLVCCSYISDHLNSIGSNLVLLLGNYENIFLMDDFNCDMHNVDLQDFCKLYNLKSLIQKCFKNGSCRSHVNQLL